MYSYKRSLASKKNWPIFRCQGRTLLEINYFKPGRGETKYFNWLREACRSKLPAEENEQSQWVWDTSSLLKKNEMIELVTCCLLAIWGRTLELMICSWLKSGEKDSVETVMTNKLNELKENRRLKTEHLEWLFSKLVAINIWVSAQNCWQKKNNNLNERTKINNI